MCTTAAASSRCTSASDPSWRGECEWRGGLFGVGCSLGVSCSRPLIAAHNTTTTFHITPHHDHYSIFYATLHQDSKRNKPRSTKHHRTLHHTTTAPYYHTTPPHCTTPPHYHTAPPESVQTIPLLLHTPITHYHTTHGLSCGLELYGVNVIIIIFVFLLYCLVLYNTIQYKNEYYYSGINPVEFRSHIIIHPTVCATEWWVWWTRPTWC